MAVAAITTPKAGGDYCHRGLLALITGDRVGPRQVLDFLPYVGIKNIG